MNAPDDTIVEDRLRATFRAVGDRPVAHRAMRHDALTVLADNPPGTRKSRWVTVVAAAVAMIVLVAVVSTAASRSKPPSVNDLVKVAVSAGSCPQADSNGVANFTVTMQVNATPDEIAAVRDVIAAQPGVSLVCTVDQAAAYRQFRRIFRRDPDLVSSIHARDFPVSLQIHVSKHPNRVQHQLGALNSVDTVQSKR